VLLVVERVMLSALSAVHMLLVVERMDALLMGIERPFTLLTVLGATGQFTFQRCHAVMGHRKCTSAYVPTSGLSWAGCEMVGVMMVRVMVVVVVGMVVPLLMSTAVAVAVAVAVVVAAARMLTVLTAVLGILEP
jgi:hypothetical protein